MWPLAAAVVAAGTAAAAVRTTAATAAVAVALLAADPDQDDDNDDPPPAYITTIHMLLCHFTFQIPLLCSLFRFVFYVLFPVFPAAGTYLVRNKTSSGSLPPKAGPNCNKKFAVSALIW